jgi:hypothetical protein
VPTCSITTKADEAGDSLKFGHYVPSRKKATSVICPCHECPEKVPKSDVFYCNKKQVKRVVDSVLSLRLRKILFLAQNLNKKQLTQATEKYASHATNATCIPPKPALISFSPKTTLKHFVLIKNDSGRKLLTLLFLCSRKLSC